MRGMHKQVMNEAALAAVTNSKTISCLHLSQGSLQVVWSSGSSAAGDINMFASNDDGETWTQVGLPGGPAISGASGSHMIELDSLPYDKVRFQWDRSAGSCDLEMWFAGKTA